MGQCILKRINILLVLTILSGCASGGTNATTADNIRQTGVTISASPVFPYDPLTANQYTLLVSNHTAQEVSLLDSKILNSSLAESVNLSEIVDSSSCQEIAAGANCSLSIKLPYVKTNGYVNFSLDYQDNLTAKKYSLSKLVAFSRDIAESNGMLYSLKYSEKIIVNSDKFTFALPLSLKQDYAKIELQLAGQKAGGYSAINCDSESGYSNHSNCTALVELDSHIAHPKLSLKTTDKNGLENTISLMLNVEYNNIAHLLYLNAPLVVRATDSAVEVTVVNIGTATATNVTTPWTPSATIDLTQSSNCGTQLKLNEICKLTYGQRLGQAGGVGAQQQAVNYFGGAKGVQTDKFNVYRNSAALSAPSIDSVYPTNNEVVDNVKPVIRVSFTQAIDSDTINDSSFYVTQGTDMTHLPGTIVFSANNAIIFTPTADLIRGAEYHLTLKTNQIGNRAGKVSATPNATEVIDFTIKQPIITISSDSAAQVIMGDSFRFTARINDTTSPTISSVTAQFVDPSVVGSISSDSGSCELNAGTGTKSCSFTATINAYSSWDPSKQNGLSNNYQIKITASGNDIKLIGESLSFTINTPTVYLAATGQTATAPITATEGADGYYRAGVESNPRFESGMNIESNCITDNLTGLMWIKDLKTINGGKSTTWQGALDLIANANVGSGFCGHKDWYLPTINDLSSLIDYSSPNPSTWLNTQGFINVSRSTYWSSTTYARDTNMVHAIYMLKFNSTMLPGTTNGVIWPVRRTLFAEVAPARVPVTGEKSGAVGSDNGIIWTMPRFISGRGATADCIIDKLTGLMWIRDHEMINTGTGGVRVKWQNALDIIKQANSTSGYCGYKDWRLPNVNELRSLINYSQSDPAAWLNINGFANLGNNYWSSTTYSITQAWTISLTSSSVAIYDRDSNNGYLLPVRGGR